MNINLLRTPEGLNQYLNEELKKLSVKLPDFMLERFLWQKVKNDFLITDDEIENLLEDDKKRLLVIKANEEETKLMIGYLHIQDDLHINSKSYLEIISKKAKEIADELHKLSIINKWSRSQVFIITTFRLSGYSEIELSQFPANAKYLYLTDSPNQKEKFYEIVLDKETNDFFESGVSLKQLLDYGANYFKNQNNNTCPKCGSLIRNSDDGCQTCGYPWNE